MKSKPTQWRIVGEGDRYFVEYLEPDTTPTITNCWRSVLSDEPSIGGKHDPWQTRFWLRAWWLMVRCRRRQRRLDNEYRAFWKEVENIKANPWK
jgi:hypothetical protein